MATSFHYTNTPEAAAAALGRNDSKNPATTCKGITSSGRPCRRALKATPSSSPTGGRRSSGTGINGVALVVEANGHIEEADFYCWQHKDQAQTRVDEVNNASRKSRVRRKKSSELIPLQEKSSIDTLVQKLGIQDEEKKLTKNPKPPRKTATTDFAESGARPQCPSNAWAADAKQHGSRPPRRDSSRKKPGFWSSLCCTGSAEDDYVEIVRHRRRTDQASRPQHPSQQTHAEWPPRIPHESRVASGSVPSRKPLSPALLPRPPQQRTTSNPQTGHLLSLIPQHCSPQTTSALLAELIKPISSADEQGYIYIFWLTPQSREAPAESTARSLLAAPSDRAESSRRLSDVMTEFSYDGGEDTSRGMNSRRAGKKTIMLKIGRANNVTRRMNEWQRQCGYKLNLVRWYPYFTSTPQPSPNQPLYPDLSRPPASRRQSDVVRKVPCVKRVERLIHLELAEKRVLKDCEACGKEHREWFEVEASQEGVRNVDECVRRWVDWAERQATT